MKQSNIFVYIELSKLTDGLRRDGLDAKQCLKQQAGYFNIITPKYFSDTLSPEWIHIAREITKVGPKLDANGQILTNAIVHSIEQMSQSECLALCRRICDLYEKVKLEFRF